MKMREGVCMKYVLMGHMDYAKIERKAALQE
jgi:hypothetical protein